MIINKNSYKTTKSIYLYDIAGAFIATFFLAPLVSISWNAIVISIILFFLKKFKIGFELLFGIILISIGGAILDAVTYIFPTQSFIGYICQKQIDKFFVTHTTGFGSCVYPNNFGLYFMILPILSIGVFNYFIAKTYFKLKKSQSIVVGILMGLLTAPWILYLYAYGPGYY